MSPIIVLVRPQLAENIGAAARAMSNFGLSELRLVAPRDGWPQARAMEVASGGEPILKKAKLFETVEEALADVHLAFATTGRMREIKKRVATPEEAMTELASSLRAQRSNPESLDRHGLRPRDDEFRGAILFGPERTGLENEDVMLCDALVTIPTSTENPSLNLGQSVVVLGYVWNSLSKKTKKPQVESLADKSELSGLFEQLETALDACNYFREPNKREGLWQNIRSLFLRAGLSPQEVQTLRGIIRALREPRGPVSAKGKR